MIVLTDSLLEWLRDVPGQRAVHMLKLLADLLRKHGEREWSDRLQDTAARLRAARSSRDPAQVVSVLQEVLGLFSSGTSLNDLFLSPDKGHKIKVKEMDLVNSRLGALRTQLYLSARQTIARVNWKQHNPGK